LPFRFFAVCSVVFLQMCTILPAPYAYTREKFRTLKMKIVMVASLILLVTNSGSAQKYLIYLHGKIVEDQGAAAESPYFGGYKYEAILSAFRNEKFVVMSEVRKPNTDVKEYA